MYVQSTIPCRPTVIAAERAAIEVCHRLAGKTHGKGPITCNLILHILGEEVEHEDVEDEVTVVKTAGGKVNPT